MDLRWIREDTDNSKPGDGPILRVTITLADANSTAVATTLWNNAASLICPSIYVQDHSARLKGR